jgi:hypothetical protein
MKDMISPYVASCLPKFTVSEPVFNVVYDEYWNTARVVHSEAHKAPLPQETDNAITNIAITCFSERFDESAKKFVYDETTLISKTLNQCYEIVEKYFCAHSALKKPENSVVYKFIFGPSMINNSDFNDDIARVARYIAEHRHDSKHKTNILALINAIKDKHDR